MTKYILTASGQLCHIDVSESELYHYGVPGMKWGQRKQRVPVAGGMRRRGSSQTSTSTTSGAKAKAARDRKKSRVKKGIVIGAAVAGTALAAFGAYKFNKAVNNHAYKKAREFGVNKVSDMLNAELTAKKRVESLGGTYASTTLDRLRSTGTRNAIAQETRNAYNSMSYGGKVKSYIHDLRRR